MRTVSVRNPNGSGAPKYIGIIVDQTRTKRKGIR